MIFVEKDAPLSREEVDEKIAILCSAVKRSIEEDSSDAIKEAFFQVVPTFHAPEEINEHAAESAEMQNANEASVAGK
jgi:hypothetical protein